LELHWSFIGKPEQQLHDALHHKIYGYRSNNCAPTTIPIYTLQTSNYYNVLADIGYHSDDDSVHSSETDLFMDYDDSDTEYSSEEESTPDGLQQTAIICPVDEPQDEEDEDYYTIIPDDLTPEYEAQTLGREIIAKPPRFNIEELKPYEVMFCDGKAYDIPQRGGWTTAFILLDLKSESWWKVDCTNKKDHPNALHHILVTNGVHLLPYTRTLFTDGCGSMAPVRTRAIKMGINAVRIPPHEQSLNEAERIADRAWAAGRTYITDNEDALPTHMALAVDMACYTKLRMATTASRNWLTPAEIIKGVAPSISHMVPFFTPAQVTVPKSKRSKLVKEGKHDIRAESGYLVGYMDMWSTTYKVLLSDNRIVHSRNVTFSPIGSDTPGLISNKDIDIKDHASEPLTELFGKLFQPVSIPQGGALQDPTTSTDYNQSVSQSHSNELFQSPSTSWDFSNYEPSPTPTPSPTASEMGFEQPIVDIPELTLPEEVGSPRLGKDIRATRSKDIEHYTPLTGDTVGIHQCIPQDPRTRFLATTKKLDEVEHHCDIFYAAMDNAMKTLDSAGKAPDVEAYNEYGTHRAVQAQKDMSWKKALQTHPNEVKAAYDKEIGSLLKTILTEITPEHENWYTAVQQAIPGRALLDIKRSGAWKARLVKQGFKEDRTTADGPNFNYYSNVVRFSAVRSILARRRTMDRLLCTIDVQTAFLQSQPYPDGMVKYLSCKNPITGKWHYYEQSGPIYGEASAPVRWEDTLAPWIESIGFHRGQNEPAAFWHHTRDIVLLTFVDDLLIDGYQADIDWFLRKINGRFECKDEEYLRPGQDLDYLGMEVSIHHGNIHLSMKKYIENACDILNIKPSVRIQRPIQQPIDTESRPLTYPEHKHFLTAVGMLGWLFNTVRMDVSYAYSRIAQHSAKPTESALKAVHDVFRYLQNTSHLSICINSRQEDRDTASIHNRTSPTDEWIFYSDTDHAGNREKQNKRRSQNGLIGTLNSAPVLWYSKASSVAFASPDIGEAHADMSSASVESYGAGNATMEILGFSYVSEEMGMVIPKPYILKMDNAAAIIFTQGSAQKTKMKHIDCRQEWVKTLRDKKIVQAEHVPTKENIADLMTKILDIKTFTYLRDKCMKPLPPSDK